MVNPEATYDSLFIVEHLGEALHGVTSGEVHLFGYLARLLALFRGAPAVDWEYMFTRTNWGAPFSREIKEAIEELEHSGRLQIEAQDSIASMRCTSEGREFFEFLCTLERFKTRHLYLEAACSSAAAFPVSAIRQAIRSEPTLKSASGHSGPQELASGPSLNLLYEQFGALRDALGDMQSDLLVPSSVWLSYLIEKSPSFETVT